MLHALHHTLVLPVTLVMFGSQAQTTYQDTVVHALLVIVPHVPPVLIHVLVVMLDIISLHQQPVLAVRML